MDDCIARHALDQGHWPGLTLDQVKGKISEVRAGAQNSFDAGNGRRIFRKGDTVLIEDGKGGGTIFRPSPQSALDYFKNWVRRELGI